VSEDFWAVVVARVRAPKSRLAGVLDQAARQALVLDMLEHVLDACRSCALLKGTIAVVDTREAQQLAFGAGVCVVPEPPGGFGGMNAAVQAGLEKAAQCGAAGAIVLPGDLPLLSDTDLDSLISAADRLERAVVIGASRDGAGTNALLLRPPDVIAPAFGPPSVDRHAALARSAGARVSELRGLDLALDVDTPDDLEVWRALQRKMSPSSGRSTSGLADWSR